MPYLKVSGIEIFLWTLSVFEYGDENEAFFRRLDYF